MGMPGTVWSHTVARSAAGTVGEAKSRADTAPAPHASLAHQQFVGGTILPLALHRWNPCGSAALGVD